MVRTAKARGDSEGGTTFLLAARQRKKRTQARRILMACASSCRRRRTVSSSKGNGNRGTRYIQFHYTDGKRDTRSDSDPLRSTPRVHPNGKRMDDQPGTTVARQTPTQPQ